MAFIPTPGAVRCDIMFIMNGQQVHNIIWATRDMAWTQAQREALNAAVVTWWTAQVSNFSTAIALAQVETVNQDTVSAPASTLVVSPVVPGTGAGNGTQNGTALVATLRTDLRGRNYRGRLYLAGHRAADINDGISTTVAHITSLLAALAALKTAIEGLGAFWVVVSKYVNKVARANGLKTLVTGFSIDQYWDSQRRRLAGRGV